MSERLIMEKALENTSVSFSGEHIAERIEAFGLYIMVFSLPLFQSPMNIALGIALSGFIARRVMSKGAQFSFTFFGIGLLGHDDSDWTI